MSSNFFNLFYSSSFLLAKSDNNFRKSIMICQITDGVDNYFSEYL